MSGGLCSYCHLQPIVGRCRKFCPEHSRQASAIYRRLHPEWRADWNVTKEKRQEYFRDYKREYRQLRRDRGAA